jgi:hypothetical protein
MNCQDNVDNIIQVVQDLFNVYDVQPDNVC